MDEFPDGVFADPGTAADLLLRIAWLRRVLAAGWRFRGIAFDWNGSTHEARLTIWFEFEEHCPVTGNLIQRAVAFDTILVAAREYQG